MPQYIINPSCGSVAAPARDFQVKYNCKVRYFDNQIKVTCFSKPIFNPHQVERVGKSEEKLSLRQIDPETGEMAYKFVEGKTILNPFTGEYIPISKWRDPKEKKEIRSDNLKRAIDKAFEIGLSNNFRYFITLTLDQTKIDRYNPSEIYPKLKNWLSNRVSRNHMDYILFPEYHKQHEWEEVPAIHFHGLANAENLKLIDSGKRTEQGQIIYNLPGWKYGFSTVIELDGCPAVVKYVTKYITKDNARIFGRSYFSGGKTLKREVPMEFLDIDYASFQGEEYNIPAAGMSVKYKTFDLWS